MKPPPMLEAMRTGGADCAAAGSIVAQRMEALARSAAANSFNIDVLCTVRLMARRTRAVHARFTTNENLIGLVNGSGVSIHHAGNSARFCQLAFIFSECERSMVNRLFARPKFYAVIAVPA